MEGNTTVAVVAWFGVAAACILLIYLPLPQICTIMIRQAFSAACRYHDHAVCLTFDDGPDPVGTPEILEILQEHRVKATFFVLGKNAETYPKILKAICESGHEIGEHGYLHLHPWKSSPWSYLCDLFAGHNTLERLLPSKKKRLYRPTFGKANILTFAFALITKKALAFWNVDPHDYREDTEAAIARTVIDQVKEGPGASVVLLHDGRSARWKTKPTVTAAAVDTVCRKLLSKGYNFVTLRELIP